VQLLWFVLAVVLRKYSIAVHEVMWLRNLPEFMRELNSLVSRGLDTLRGSTGASIDSGYNIVTPDDDEPVHCDRGLSQYHHPLSPNRRRLPPLPLRSPPTDRTRLCRERSRGCPRVRVPVYPVPKPDRIRRRPYLQQRREVSRPAVEWSRRGIAGERQRQQLAWRRRAS
jgi:hypothetical protein